MRKLVRWLVLEAVIFSAGMSITYGATYPNGYGNRRVITIDQTKVSGTSDHSDFPVAVSGTYEYLKTTANGGKVQNANGYDIRFETASGTKLDHEMEAWSATTGDVAAWVRIPTLSCAADTSFYLYYGKAGLSSSEENTTGVWSACKGVWHLNGNSSDSSGNGGNGTDTTITYSPANGKFGQGAGFNGSSSKISLPSWGSVPTKGTILLWIKINAFGEASNPFSTFDVQYNNAIRLENDPTYLSWYVADASHGPYSVRLMLTPSAGVWYFCGITWDTSTNTITGYLNGAYAGQTTCPYFPTGLASPVMGRGFSATRWYNGKVDAMAYFNQALTAGWIETEYNNQNAPSTFYAMGEEQVFNNPPTDPSNPLPGDGAYTNDTTPLCAWGASADTDNDPITYSYTLDDDADLSSPIVNNAGTGSSTQYLNSTLGDGTYYWRVKAWDGKEYNQNPAIWSFAVDTQKPGIPQFTGYFANPDETIGKIYGTGEIGTTLTFFDKNGGALSGAVTWDGGTFTFTPTTPLAHGGSVYVQSRDGATNTAQSKKAVPVFEAYYDVSRDGDVFHGDPPGSSMRLEKDTSYEFDIAVNAGSPVTVRAWMMYNSDYDGSGADAPRVTLSGLGITTGNTAAMTAPASYTPDTWEELMVSGTPDAKGVVTLTVETFSAADGAAAWVDDVSVNQ